MSYFEKRGATIYKLKESHTWERFWSHYKDEAYNNVKFKSYETLAKSVNNYIEYHNDRRYQYKLNSLTP